MNRYRGHGDENEEGEHSRKGGWQEARLKAELLAQDLFRGKRIEKLEGNIVYSLKGKL